MKKILIHFNLPGVTTKQYEGAWADLRATGNDRPKGLIHHTGAQNGNNFVVVDVWESEDAFQKFGEVLGPIMAKNNMPNVQPTVMPVVYDYVTEKVPQM